MIALAHYGLKPADVVAELQRREGLSGIEEKALRKARERKARRVRSTHVPDRLEIIVAKTPGDRTTMHVLYGMHTVAPFTLWTLSCSR